MANEKLNHYLWFPLEGRPVPFVPCRHIDQSVVVVQGKSDSVAKLYQDFVLGRLDPSQIGNVPVYDDPNSESVDPFNHFGLTLEETTEIQEAGRRAQKDIQEYGRKKVDEMKLITKQQENQPPKEDPTS